MFPMGSLVYLSAPHQVSRIFKGTYLDQENRRVPRMMDMKARVGEFDHIHDSLRREIINIDIAVCPT